MATIVLDLPSVISLLYYGTENVDNSENKEYVFEETKLPAAGEIF